MSKEYPELLPVIQADHDVFRDIFHVDPRDGCPHSEATLQKLARHRIDGQEEMRVEIERLREALAEIASPLDGIPVGDPWAFYADPQQLARAALHTPEEKDNG